MQDPTASLKPSATLQLAMGTLLGAMQAALSEPRRAWRFLVLACGAVVVVVLYERIRKATPADTTRQTLVLPVVLMAVSWGVTGFVLTELRLLLR